MGDSSFWGGSSHSDNQDHNHEHSETKQSSGSFWGGSPHPDEPHEGGHTEMSEEHVDGHEEVKRESGRSHLKHHEIEHEMVHLGFDHKTRESVMKTFEEHAEEHGLEHFNKNSLEKIMTKLKRDTSDGIHTTKIMKLHEHLNDKISGTLH